MRGQPRPFGSLLAVHFRDFLRHHRALGKSFQTEERALRLFDQFLIDQSISDSREITPFVLEHFLGSRNRPIPKSYNHLLGVVRRWCDWMVRQERFTRSPLLLLPRRQTSVKTPFLFDPIDARQLLAIAEQLPDNNSAKQRGLVYSTIFALLYGLGLRVGEAVRLRVRDVDWVRSVLTIRQTKFAKNRLVPFGPKIAAKLEDYRSRRRPEWARLNPADPLFSFDPKGHEQIHPGTISQTFHHLWPRLNIRLPVGVATPRLHCLRHSFAVGILLGWYRAGINPNERLIQLSTFLGHSHPSSTSVYLTITAELLREANRHFEHFAGSLLKGATI